MLLIFQAAAVLGVVSILAEAVLRLVYQLHNFGIKKRFFDFRAQTIPVQRFFPHTLSDTFILLFSFGISGIVLNIFKLGWPLTLLLTLISSLWIMFFYNCGSEYFEKKSKLKNYSFEGQEARCTLPISPELYGAIEIKTPFGIVSKNAVCVNETGEIKANDEVVIVAVEEDLCFVEKKDHLLDILNQTE